MNIKQFLTDNKDKKVSSITDELLKMISQLTVSTGQTFHRNDDGEVVAIRCYYYKRWMPLVGPEAVEFGVKRSSSTGLNTMCKAGVRAWTAMNKRKKALDSEILEKLMSGELLHEQIKDYKEARLEVITQIEETDLGFETLEEALASIG